MPNPYHMVTFATKADISAFDFSTWPDGTPVFCKETNSWFVLDTSSTATADGENVLTSASGRLLKQTAKIQNTFTTSVPTAAPQFIGERLTVRLSSPLERTIEYLAIGTTSSADWIITGGSPIDSDDTPVFYGFSPDYVGQIYSDSLTPATHISTRNNNGDLVWLNVTGTIAST